MTAKAPPEPSAHQRRIDGEVDRHAQTLVALSQKIHANPETGFKEVQASQWLAALLEASGFTVERGVGGLSTSFRATLAGTANGPNVAILSKYDALPELGHACGHNIIATTGVGAGLAIATSGVPFAGRLTVIGTPAEEGGRGRSSWYVRASLTTLMQRS